MAVPKYKKQFEEMLEMNKDLFSSYRTLQSNFNSDPEPYRDELNEVKRKIIRVIAKNEDALCAKSENNKKYVAFSTNLADKFWEEIRANFPQIDDITE